MILSNETKMFLEQEILPKLNINKLSEENANIIVDFITNNYEVPLSQAEEAGEPIDTQLLKVASFAVTELTKKW